MIELSRGSWSKTLGQLRDCGGGQRECVVFWIAGRSNPSLVTAVVHPEHIATPYFYEVDDSWHHMFALRLAAHEESVVAQVHTHSGRAFHSKTDDAFPLVHQAGFLSLVVPRFAMSPQIEELYLAQIGSDGAWSKQEPAALIGGLNEQ